MSTTNNREHASAGLTSRPLFVTSLVAGLAMSTMVGCSWTGSSNSQARYSSGSQYWTATRASLSDQTIDPASTTGQSNTAA